MEAVFRRRETSTASKVLLPNTYLPKSIDNIVANEPKRLRLPSQCSELYAICDDYADIPTQSKIILILGSLSTLNSLNITSILGDTLSRMCPERPNLDQLSWSNYSNQPQAHQQQFQTLISSSFPPLVSSRLHSRRKPCDVH